MPRQEQCYYVSAGALGAEHTLVACLQEGALTDVVAVRRQLLKLTRTSWTLTYEALAAAFQHTADCVAWQIGTLLAARCIADPRTGTLELRGLNLLHL